MDQQLTIAPARARRATFTMEQVKETLGGVALFDGFGGDDLQEILHMSQRVRVQADEYVFEEGDQGDRFYVIIHGEVELRRASGTGVTRLALLRGGEAFGEAALLNPTPRTASAVAVVDTYMLSISRDAFGRILGRDTLPVRLLRNFSKVLWATSVRMAAEEAQRSRYATPRDVLADFNRQLRTRILPRVTPRVSGYDVAASTLTPRQGVGSSSWDWFLMADGRPVLAVMKAERADLFSAQRLATARALLRSGALGPRQSLGALLTGMNRGLMSGWVDGLSGPVSCSMVALAEGSAEWVGAGDITGMVVRAGGASRDLNIRAPAAGERTDHAYESSVIELGARDKLICMSECPPNLTRLVTSVLTGRYTSSSRDALTKLFGRIGQVASGAPPASDLTGAVMTYMKPA